MTLIDDDHDDEHDDDDDDDKGDCDDEGDANMNDDNGMKDNNRDMDDSNSGGNSGEYGDPSSNGQWTSGQGVFFRFSSFNTPGNHHQREVDVVIGTLLQSWNALRARGEVIGDKKVIFPSVK